MAAGVDHDLNTHLQFSHVEIRVAVGTALVLATLGTVLWIELSPREHEPVYQGKTLTYWLSDFWPGRNPTREKVEQDKLAVRQDPEAGAKAGIQFGTSGTIAGWNPPPAATNK